MNRIQAEKEQNKDILMAGHIAHMVREQGGTVYYVGGFVRDRLLGLENKDIDLEVHGIAPERLEAILASLGEVKDYGESFGIFGLSHYHLDIAMPRSEKATGTGHRDFLCTVDPFIGVEKAAIRRDFSINAMMQDVLTGEIVDPFRGQEDLRAGVIRHMDDRRFAEDPLRVLRGAQFAARFGFRIAEETLALCSRMDLTTLAPERIFGEMEKALLKAEKPSVFFSALRRMEQLEFWFPELRDLIDVPQPPSYHPEGDVWTHTMLVTDEAARLREKAEYPLGLMLAALCHDLGKAETTRIEKDGRLHAFQHEQAGAVLAERFLARITNEKKLKRYVKNMVKLHMRPNQLAAQHARRRSFNRLFDESVAPDDLLLLSQADALGSCVSPEEYSRTAELLQRRLSDFHAQMAEAYMTGQDLIDAGFQAGPDFSRALAYAHRAQLAGVSREEVRSQTIGYLTSLESERKKQAE